MFANLGLESLELRQGLIGDHPDVAAGIRSQFVVERFYFPSLVFACKVL